MNTSVNRCKLEQEINNLFNKYNITNNVYIAYSGGIDSTVLLHSLCKYIHHNHLEIKIIPIHIHHGISKYANEWLEHCKIFANNLGLDLIYHKVDITQYSSELGIEAAARMLRYQAINQTAQQNPVLLGHHAQDQLETFVLQWQRGSGIDGLCSMPYFHQQEQTPYYRPFLNLDKKYIIEYAHQHKLKWIEDDSNSDDKYKRNAVRMHILPKFNSDELQPMLRTIQTLQIQKSVLDKYLASTINNIKSNYQAKFYAMPMPSSKLINDKLNNINQMVNHAYSLSLDYLKFKEIFTQDYEHGILLFRYWLKLNNLEIPSYKQIHSFVEQLKLKQDSITKSELFGIEANRKNCNANSTNSTSRSNFKCNKYDEKLSFSYNQDICISYGSKYITLYNNIIAVFDNIYMLNHSYSNLGSIELLALLAEYNNSQKNHININNDVEYKIASQCLKVRMANRPTKILKHIFQEQKIAPWLRGLYVVCDKSGYVVYHPYINNL